MKLALIALAALAAFPLVTRSEDTAKPPTLQETLEWLQRIPKLSGIVNKKLDPDRFKKLTVEDLKTLKAVQIGGHVADEKDKALTRENKAGGHLHLPSAEYRYLTVLPALEKLSFPENNLDDEALVHIGKIKTLKDLHLAESKFTNDGLAHLTGLQELVILDIRANKNLDDKCVPHLAKLSKLQGLWVRNTNITPAGIMAIEKALPNCKVSVDVRKGLFD